MNDPKEQPIDIDEQRAWLNEQRGATGASLSELARRVGIPLGTLSQFASASYKGNNQKIAQSIFRYRQVLVAQAQIAIEAPEVPVWFETETSKQLIQLLNWAQRGRIVVAATGAGMGKTKTLRHFAACTSNCFLATMSPSTAGVNNMQIEVLEALGEANAVGTPQKLSRRIKDRVKDLGNPLIAIDEAQHLSEKALEEIRSWHDATGVGIALFGNLSVLQRLEGGSRKAAFAQLYSRLGMRMVRTTPLQADADALAAAWGIEGDAEVAYIRKIAMMPGALRGASHMIELGSMIALSERRALAVDHLQDAWAQLSSRPVAS